MAFCLMRIVEKPAVGQHPANAPAKASEHKKENLTLITKKN